MNKKHFNKSRKNWLNSLSFNVSNVKRDPSILLEVVWYTQQSPEAVQEFLGRYHGGKLLINTEIQSFSHSFSGENGSLSFFRQFLSTLLSEAQVESLSDLHEQLKKSKKYYLRTAFSELEKNLSFLEYYTDDEGEIILDEDGEVVTGEFYDFLNVHPKSLSCLIGEILESLGADWLEEEEEEILSQSKINHKIVAKNPTIFNIYQGAQRMSYGIFDAKAANEVYEKIKNRLSEIPPSDLSIKEKEDLVATIYEYMTDEAECDSVLTAIKEDAVKIVLTLGQRKNNKITDFVSSVIEIFRKDLEEAQQSKSGTTGCTAKNKNYARASAINSQKENSHWNRYKNHLLKNYVSQGKWTLESLDILDAASTSVLWQLGRPTPRNEFNVKGLVMGHVQSGKTANIIAVVAKAADAGYKNIIVLSGRTEVLRAQTQSRLVSELEVTIPNGWHIINNKDQNNREDISGCVEIGVFLKTGIIKRNGGYGGSLGDVYEHLRREENILIIDDECDTATPNGLAAEEDPQRTICNQIINAILGSHKHISYVGYSATPFANMLMDPNDPNDVYPKDFILSLQKPKGDYIGSDDIFHQELNANSEIETFQVENRYDVLKDLDDREANTISGGPRNTKPLPDDLSRYPALKQAAFHFLMALLLRKKRTAMIVNPARMNGIHEKVASLLENIFKDIANETDEELQKAVSKWTKENSASVGASLAKTMLSPRNIKTAIKGSVAICLMNQNGNAGIDEEGHHTFNTTYGNGDAEGVIFVGGEMLSRGVTFDGLVVTYFARSSKNYSTLIQMGRWLGYRRPDMSLCRVWMTKEKQEAYLEFTKIEQEIRDLIEKHYKNQEIEPCDLPLCIRQIPGYEVIRPEQLGRHVQMHSFDFSGDKFQTSYFYDDRYDYEQDEEFNAKLDMLRNSDRQCVASRVIIFQFVAGHSSGQET